MSSTSELELALAETRYYHDRVALLRAKNYRWGLGSSRHLEHLERQLQRAERRLTQVRNREVQ